MNKLLVKIYGAIPNGLKLKLGQSQVLKGLRRFMLYNSKGFKTAKVLVNRTYGSHHVNFNFVASIKIASKAKQVGIENTVLRHSVALTDKYFSGRDNLIVLDVGSNFGYLASVWADSVAAEGKVLAFEPNKSLFKTIQKTIEANSKFLKNFEAYNLAVGANKGIVKLNASQFSSNTEDMASAIDTYDVDMITLDDLVKEQKLSDIDLIKIDVDGIELDILKGAQDILKKNHTIVIVETNNDEQIIDFFMTIGYSIYDMNLQLFDASNQLPLNIFCIPNTLEVNAI